jgi:heme exporter protein A
MTALLRFENVDLRRGGRLLVEGLSLELGPGERLQIAGCNGSGKSSLIRLAAGLLQPERGTVHRTRLALADDAVALDRELPLARALGFWSDGIDEAMEALDLAQLARVPVRLLSSGQLKRATLARVFAASAPLWLLDEPLNALDTNAAERLSRRIDQHLKSGGAVLAASHQPLAGEWPLMELAA